jgi:tetratricopeptide (TPR) repeat protein
MLKESQRLSPDPRTLLELGSAYGLSGDVDKETASYEEALAADPDMHEAHFKAAVAYDKSRKEGAARLTFEHAKAAIRLDPKYKAKFQNMLKNSDVAKLIAEKVIKIVNASEDGELDDAQIDAAAKEFEKLLGGPGKNIDVRKVLQDPKIADAIKKVPADQREGFIKNLNPDEVRRIVEKNTPKRTQ